MQLAFEPTGTPDAFATALERLAVQDTIQAVLVLGCDANGWQPQDVDELIQNASISVFGGIFPQIAYQGRSAERGTLLIGITQQVDIGVVEGLSDAETVFEHTLDEWVQTWPLTEPKRTHIVLVDGLASRISELIESLFFTFGVEHNLIGGGAGSLSFEQRPCIITPQGLRQDVALIASLPVASYIGMAHGWASISESVVVTSSTRNVIKSIDWQPAAEVYRTLIRSHSGIEIPADDFFSVAKSYPLGIAKLGTEMVVRDPLMMTEAGELVCVGEVPEGCSVRLLHGKPDMLIAAAHNAAEQALTTAPSGSYPHRFMIDCISRVLFLGDDLYRELDAVSRDTPVFGAFTLGEIANSGSDYLEFYNKTIVLALLDS